LQGYNGQLEGRESDIDSDFLPKTAIDPCFYFKQFVQHRRIVNLKFKMAEKFHNSKKLKLLFGYWRSITARYRQINAVVNAKVLTANGYLMRDAFQVWTEYTQAQKESKANENLAVAFYLKNILIKVA
jgi:hypothetical protein